MKASDKLCELIFDYISKEDGTFLSKIIFGKPTPEVRLSCADTANIFQDLLFLFN